MALLLGCLLSYGVQVGPLADQEHPRYFLGSRLQHVYREYHAPGFEPSLNRALGKNLESPLWILFPLILLFCVVGVYSINTTTHEVILMVVFGVIGYLLKKCGYEAAPLIMAMILSPLMENNLRQSLALSHGSFTIFFTRPISAVLMITTIVLLILPNLPAAKKAEEMGGIGGDAIGHEFGFSWRIFPIKFFSRKLKDFACYQHRGLSA